MVKQFSAIWSNLGRRLLIQTFQERRIEMLSCRARRFHEEVEVRRDADCLDPQACWRSRRIDHHARLRLTTSTDSEPSPRDRLDAGGPGQSAFGHLVKFRRAPTTPSQVSAFHTYLESYAHEQQASGRFGWAPNIRLRDLSAWLDFEQVVPSQTKLSFVVALCLLLVCMVNTVGLLLAKFLRRSGEIGVRRALGASRFAIATQFAAEAGVIGVTGGLLGLMLTWLGVQVMRDSLPRQIAALAYLDLPLLWQTLLLAVAATVLAALYPIWRAMYVRPSLQLKED